MRALALLMLFTATGLMSLTAISAQPPDGPKDKGDGPRRDVKPNPEEMIERIMAFDTNKDGKLTKDELTEPRLQRLFERADADKDGVITKEELTAFAKQVAAAGGEERRPPAGGPGGAPGGPGGAPGGRPGGAGGPPQPGQILPPFVQQMLKLTDDQKKQIEELQATVDAKLAKILTEEQAKQLKESRNRMGPGGRPGGFPGGPPGGGQPPPPPKE
jgi:hypothetical protein